MDDPHGYIEMLAPEPLDRPAVWHLHGSIQRPHSLILALDDYKRLYLPSTADAEGRRYGAALQTLKTIVGTRTLLFVGFSFADEHLLAQMEAIATLFDGATRNHYVLVREAQRKALEKKLEHLSVICVEYENHGPPLIQVLNDLAAHRKVVVSSGSGGGPSSSTVAAGNVASAAPAHSTTPVGSQVLALSTSALPTWAVTSRREVDALLLLSGWTPSFPRDCEAVTKLRADPTELERLCVELAGLPDAPVRSFEDRSGRLRFTWSDPASTWRTLVTRLPPTILKDFGDVATEILSEQDPGLDMSRDQRFLAAVQGKVVITSAILREGVAKTLVRLSMSDELLQPTHGTSRGSLLAHRVVYNVLGEDWRVWASLDALLPLLAESAPQTFLERVEGSVRSTSQLLSEETPHGGSVHTGLLRALETVGWRPELMPRVAVTLARLAAMDPGGRLANRPTASLTNLLHPLLPQSSSTGEQRTAVLRTVIDREPEIGWKVARSLFGLVVGSGTVVFPSRRPQIARWNLPTETHRVAGDAGEQLEALSSLLIAHASEKPEGWESVLEPLWRMPVAMSKRVLAALAESLPTDRDDILAQIRELLHDGFEYGEAWKVHPELVQRLEEIYRLLTPEDPVRRVAWLFNQASGVPEKVEGGWQAHQTRLAELRADAVADLWKRGERWSLLEQIAQSAGAEWLLGAALAESSFADEVEARLLGVEDDALTRVLPSFASRRYGLRGIEWVRGAVARLVEAGRQHQAALVLANLSTSTAVMDLVDHCGDPVRSDYWRSISGVYGEHPADEWERAIAGLLSVNRPGAALDVASQAHDVVQPTTALAVLEKLSLATGMGDSRFLSGSGSYHLDRVFEAVDRMGPDLPVDRVIALELYFLPILEDGARGPKHLFAALESSPQYFSEFVAFIWKSSESTARREPRAGAAQPGVESRAYGARCVEGLSWA